MASLALLVAFVAVTPVIMGTADSKLVEITNSCPFTVWAGISSSSGAGAGAGSSAAIDSSGFELAPGASRVGEVPPVWSGRLWGRTGYGPGDMVQDYSKQPLTLVELNFNESRGNDFYDINLVSGYNLAVLVEPLGAAAADGRCTPVSCVLELSECPPDLRVVVTSSGSGTGGAVVGCRSACQAFGSAEYCCTSEYGTSSTCKPSAYSKLFKIACPQAMTYSYDESESIFTCMAVDYTVNFCPARTTSGAGTGTDQPSPYNDGNSQEVGAASSSDDGITSAVAILTLVAAVLSVVAAVLGIWKYCF